MGKGSSLYSELWKLLLFFDFSRWDYYSELSLSQLLVPVNPYKFHTLLPLLNWTFVICHKGTGKAVWHKCDKRALTPKICERPLTSLTISSSHPITSVSSTNPYHPIPYFHIMCVVAWNPKRNVCFAPYLVFCTLLHNVPLFWGEFSVLKKISNKVK